MKQCPECDADIPEDRYPKAMAMLPHVAAHEKTRYAINAVAVYKDRVVSTDGRALLMVPCETSVKDDTHVFIPGLSDARFPNYKEVIPDYSGSPHTVTLRADLLARLVSQMVLAGSEFIELVLSDTTPSTRPTKFIGIGDDIDKNDPVVGLLMPSPAR